ncbi:hypothetical protein ES332_A08G254300v1 [Gossypium tomentosum]|uniref:Uncharacterized protein n=1 Tax=Gossypium tomentosum TaxID=34277 RepID=A0A5D2PNG6_GOSTO|nr:hypothetical protein ES332_A08G254300v1 [Gossypium tomentosum]
MYWTIFCLFGLGSFGPKLAITKSICSLLLLPILCSYLYNQTYKKKSPNLFGGSITCMRKAFDFSSFKLYFLFVDFIKTRRNFERRMNSKRKLSKPKKKKRKGNLYFENFRRESSNLPPISQKNCINFEKNNNENLLQIIKRRTKIMDRLERKRSRAGYAGKW